MTESIYNLYNKYIYIVHCKRNSEIIDSKNISMQEWQRYLSRDYDFHKHNHSGQMAFSS